MFQGHIDDPYTSFWAIMFIRINLFNFLNDSRQRVLEESEIYLVRLKLVKNLQSITCTTSSPLMTLPNTMSFSFKSGIGAVVRKSSNPLPSCLIFEVPSINASCFGLYSQVRVKLYL